MSMYSELPIPIARATVLLTRKAQLQALQGAETPTRACWGSANPTPISPTTLPALAKDEDAHVPDMPYLRADTPAGKGSRTFSVQTTSRHLVYLINAAQLPCCTQSYRCKKFGIGGKSSSPWAYDDDGTRKLNRERNTTPRAYGVWHERCQVHSRPKAGGQGSAFLHSVHERRRIPGRG